MEDRFHPRPHQRTERLAPGTVCAVQNGHAHRCRCALGKDLEGGLGSDRCGNEAHGSRSRSPGPDATVLFSLYARGAGAGKASGDCKCRALSGLGGWRIAARAVRQKALRLQMGAGVRQEARSTRLAEPGGLAELALVAIAAAALVVLFQTRLGAYSAELGY